MASRDYYEILGVGRTASADEIKRAHRKLALEFHPDRNKAEGAAARFNEVQEAYDVLSDADKRKQYDEFVRLGGSPGSFGQSGGMPPGVDPFSSAWRQQARSGQAWSGGADPFDFESMFRDSFGGCGAGAGTRGARGQRARAREREELEVTVPLERAILGGKAGVSIDGKPFDIEIPIGLEEEGLVSVPGRLDAVVRVHFAPHAWLERDDRDLAMRLPVSIVEATIGAAIEVPLPTGGSVTLKIPAGTASGRKLRVAGKGIPASSVRAAGDLLVEIQIVPPREVDDLTRQLLGNIADRIEDPRARVAWKR